MEVKDYIGIVLSHIKNKVFLASIEQELEDHIADRAEYYEKIGYDTEVSLQKAMEHIGNPDVVGEQMNRLYTNKGTEKAVIIANIIQIATWIILFFAVYSSMNYTYSSVFYAVRAHLTVAFLFFIILVCCCFGFTLASRTRNNKLMKSIAYTNAIMPFLSLVKILVSFEISINFSVFKGMTFSDVLVYSTNQFLFIYILFVYAVLLLTVIVSYMLSTEFKAFEKGKAQMSVIYRAEKYKYFLYAMCVPFVVYVVLFIGSAYGYCR